MDDDDVACVERWGLHIRAGHPSLDKVVFVCLFIKKIKIMMMMMEI